MLKVRIKHREDAAFTPPAKTLLWDAWRPAGSELLMLKLRLQKALFYHRPGDAFCEMPCALEVETETK